MIIVHSRTLENILVFDYKVKNEKINLVNHGIENSVTLTNEKKAKNKMGWLKKKIILFFGYLTKYKGIDTLIKSFNIIKANYPDTILVVAGGLHPRLRTDPDYKQYIQELTNQKDIKVTFPGFIPDKMISLYFNSADLVIFPYNTVFSFSGPFNMAISYLKPIIATDIPPFNEYLPQKFLFTKNNSQELSKKIQTLIGDEQLKKQYKNYLKQLKEKYSWRNMAKKTIKLYKSMC
jgi:glycosyltransferase involved in cell wall biosynthesis